MITLTTFRLWWGFFHRYGLINKERSFDRVVLLSLKTLDCPPCREDATKRYTQMITDESGLSNFQKIWRLHNYVNKKLNKPIISEDGALELTRDVYQGNGKIDLTKLLGYYFDYLFAIAQSCPLDYIMDLKEVSGLIYQSLAPDSARPLAIQINPQHKDRTTVYLKIYDYYTGVPAHLRKAGRLEGGFQIKTFNQWFPKSRAIDQLVTKKAPCKSCGQRRKRPAALKLKSGSQVKTVSVVSVVTPKPLSAPIPPAIVPIAKVAAKAPAKAPPSNTNTRNPSVPVINKMSRTNRVIHQSGALAPELRAFRRIQRTNQLIFNRK